MFTVQGRHTLVPVQPRVVEQVLLRCHRATVAIQGWTTMPPDVFMLLMKKKTCNQWGLEEDQRDLM